MNERRPGIIDRVDRATTRVVEGVLSSRVVDRALFGKKRADGKPTIVTRAMMLPFNPREALGRPPKRRRTRKLSKVSVAYNSQPRSGSKT